VGGSIFILVVDDDAAFADAAARSFESVGMRTVVALGATAAIDGFDSNAIDVVVTDIKPPEGEPRGSVLARMIKNKRPHVPIILMTAHPELLKKDVPPPGATLCKPLEVANSAARSRFAWHNRSHPQKAAVRLRHRTRHAIPVEAVVNRPAGGGAAVVRAVVASDFACKIRLRR
jgi:CheY-like chemotaxis protein